MNDARTFRYIDRDEALEAWICELADADVIAVDTESDSMHRYREKVCLIQMTAGQADVIVDPFSVNNIELLAPVFADPHRVKVFHDAGYDLLCLRRDFNFEFRGLFDTMLASRLLGKRHFGLASLLSEYFEIELDKTLRRSDWSRRPLSEQQLAYARCDTLYLPDLKALLEQELIESGRLDWAAEEFARLPGLALEVAGRAADDRVEDGFWKIKGVDKLSPLLLGRVQALYLLRETVAEQLDRPAYKVFSNTLILDLAKTPPRNLGDLRPRPGLRRAGLERFGEKLVAALNNAKPLTAKRPKGGGRRRRTGRFLDPRLRDRYEALREMRRSVAAGYKLEPEVMLSNFVLEKWTSLPPLTLDAFEKCDFLNSWQVTIFAEPVLACLCALETARQSVDD